jgi:dipeptidyl aminopeptidase/acylaminoacyl peptidase
VVALFPPTDLRPSVGPSKNFPALDFDPGLAETVSPLLHVTPDDPPALLIHGDKDTLVKLDQSRQIHEAFQKIGVTSELIVLEGAGHGFRGDDDTRATNEVVAWFDKNLAPPKSGE